MGQRLVITVRSMGQDVAKIYYHWDAYTYDAILDAKRIVNYIYDREDKTEKDLQLALIRFCEARGGGIYPGRDGDERNYIQSVFPNETFKKEGYDRNYGLIAISERGMKEMQMWSEGDVEINLDEEVVFNRVFEYYENIDEYNKERKEWDDEFNGLSEDDVPEIGYDIGLIGIGEIDDVLHALYNTTWNVVKHGKEIFELVL